MAHSDIILDTAYVYATGKGYHFGSGADGYIQQRALDAGAEIDRLPANSQNAKLKEATENFTKLIDEMIKAAKTIPGYQDRHPDSIGEETLATALDKLCPIWPFC